VAATLPFVFVPTAIAIVRIVHEPVLVRLVEDTADFGVRLDALLRRQKPEYVRSEGPVGTLVRSGHVNEGWAC
jgi:hypothetical protein